MTQKIASTAFILILTMSELVFSQLPIYSNSEFQLFSDHVVQGKNVAKVISPLHIESNYQSPINLFKPAELIFKFAINGRDNEMPPGVDHQFTVGSINGTAETPIIEFGKKLTQVAETVQFMPSNAPVRFRLDFRGPKREMEERGFYITSNGQKIFKEDFKGVFIAGGASPLSWDFDNLASRKELQLKDPDGDGIYEIELIFNAHSNEKQTDSEWKVKNSLASFPAYSSSYPISDALYHLALDEMVTAIEPDNTFRTGKEWAGVWTRDISYSILLSMAILQPEVAKTSLRKKVKDKKIIQDTGTGGAWPVSTDRMIWAVAAYEIYLVTGDSDWLKYAFEVVKNSVDADLSVALDPSTGLIKGESSFLDWREQTYPRWMQPADIFESECLGTNAVHFQANIVLSEMASQLNDKISADKYKKVAAKIKRGMNQFLWANANGYYGQFLYGRTYKILSPRAEALGEALCVLFDIADKSQTSKVVQHTPVNPFGIPCIYPQIPGIPPYHNQAVWPFVQSYWALAAAKAGNEEALLQTIATIYRPAALFVTNKENFVVGSGDFAGTQVNSSNMLWSLSGSIALVYKVFFGIQYQKEGLKFAPFVPKAFAGNRRLENFRYRNANLTIDVQGFGNKIESFMLDGKKQSKPEFANHLKGNHSIVIVLNGSTHPQAKFEVAKEKTSPETPEISRIGSSISWKPVDLAVGYKVIKNGASLGVVQETSFSISSEKMAEYQVIAIDKEGVESFASEPLEWQPAPIFVDPDSPIDMPSISSKGANGKHVVEISNQKNRNNSFTFSVESNGIYAFQFRYANGNGPTNTENKCAIRNLWLGGKKLGTLVFPQRGNGEWSNWGLSNRISQPLKKGTYTVELRLDPENENMHGEINQALLDQLQITRVH